MANYAATEKRQIIEIVPLVCEHVTDIEATLIDGRVYVIGIDTRPEGVVAVGKAVIPADALDLIISKLMLVRALRDATKRRKESN